MPGLPEWQERALGSTQQHWHSCTLYHCSKASPGAQAEQAGLAVLRQSHTCQAPCLPEACVSFRPWLGYEGTWSHQQHMIPCT